MFGYHDSNRCMFDIWAPMTTSSYDKNADEIQHGYGVWEDTPYHTAIENRAFSAYALHTQELEDIIELIGNGATDIECDDNLTTLDKQYIKDEVFERYGVEVDFT